MRRRPACLAVKPLDLHLVTVGSIPTGPTHGEGRLQPHPGDVLKSTPNVRKGPRSDVNLEGRRSDPQFLQWRTSEYISEAGARHLVSQGSDDGHAPAGESSEGDLAASENSVINIFVGVSFCDFCCGRDDGLESRRNLLGETLYEGL